MTNRHHPTCPYSVPLPGSTDLVGRSERDCTCKEDYERADTIDDIRKMVDALRVQRYYSPYDITVTREAWEEWLEDKKVERCGEVLPAAARYRGHRVLIDHPHPGLVTIQLR